MIVEAIAGLFGGMIAQAIYSAVRKKVAATLSPTLAAILEKRRVLERQRAEFCGATCKNNELDQRAWATGQIAIIDKALLALADDEAAMQMAGEDERTGGST